MTADGDVMKVRELPQPSTKLRPVAQDQRPKFVDYSNFLHPKSVHSICKIHETDAIRRASP